jgi:hypothetical protein
MGTGMITKRVEFRFMVENHTTPLRHLRNRAAIAKRWNRPEADDLARQLREETLAKHIREVVNAAPPLTGEQRERLAALLAPATAGGGIP